MTDIKNIGILGGGQLGRMLAQAADSMGFKCVIWEPDEKACAFKEDVEKIIEPYDDKALKKFIKKVDVVVLEFENIPVEIVQQIEKAGKLVAPSSNVLSIVQDRQEEKKFFDDNKIPCAKSCFVDSEESARKAGQKLGYPFFLKTNRFGYDGKGQRISHNPDEAVADWVALGKVDCVAEEYVTFNREISIIGARNLDGEIVSYDIAKNDHMGGILRFSSVPAKLSDGTREKAKEYLEIAMEALDIVGLLALEMFVVDDEILANEMAARPHNSGHWTIDGAKTSQFEQCIRAAIGEPFMPCERTYNVVMRNIIGSDLDYVNLDYPYENTPSPVDKIELYYGKSEEREGRKMGHINHLYEKTE